jgi:hypothetical protein
MAQPELRVRRRGFLGGDPFDADQTDHDHDSAEGVRIRTRRARRRARTLTSRRDRRPPVAKISRRERISTAANRA